ncbi:tetratricopeptide repeat protein [Flavobacterium psychrotrophum]|uniref:tetratricopeptide repeat protein n=1 Tax=Flavobacterium psychrotrophum TaxID=2294119 RepID=UPI000E30E40D|nr:tetratricopeptide repeat protein [Flavobacterium psychrotrophum]
MKKIFLYIAFIFSVAAFAQNEQLAMNYFEKGEFEKAAIIYQDLDKLQPRNPYFAQRLAECYQQLKQFEKSEKLLLEKLDLTKQPQLYVDLGYNYQLQKNQAKADKYYQQAIDAVKDQPGMVMLIANAFEKKVLIKQALSAYEVAMAKNPALTFDYQMAILQGQLGNMELMVESLLNFAFKNQQNVGMVQNQLSRFMNEEGTSDNFNALLRKSLLLKTQKDQDIFWNEFLSWYFVQQKEYGKAFIQEKAIYRREPELFMNIVSLGQLAAEENEDATAKEIFAFVSQNTQEQDILMNAEYYLLQIDLKNIQDKDQPLMKQRIDAAVEKFGTNPYTLKLQLLKADFEAFQLKDTKAAIATLDKELKLQLNKYQEASVKLKLSDILLLDEKFNQAIIYYAQVEEDLKNDAVGNEASFRVARASYFKGDFTWAQKQLKVLKSSSSQLIANDALELFLLITDNTVEDSTQTALKKFARADFKLYQNKKQEALAEFKNLLATDKTESIQDVTLLRVGKLYESLGQYDLALQNYQEIIDKYKEGIYVDEALFFSAEIYNKKLQQPEKAKPLYEKMIFEHEDSIYFIEARKQFRILRGDGTSS